MKKLIACLLGALPLFAISQTNMTITNSTAFNILKGNYTPSSYNTASYSRLPVDIISGLRDNVSSDSIKSYWTKLGTFYNRSSGNQLSSTTRGITATFGWVASKFKEFSTANSNRLVVSDFTFTQSFCSASNHKETFAVLPGNDLTDKSILIFLAHADTRTDVSCPSSTVVAKGMEDNATGVSLVMELARVMSKYSFKQTIVFMITTGEEQGLYGSTAFATYLKNNSIAVEAAYNNDIVGSIQCILPTNTPGCSVNNSIDSVSVRLFSTGDINSISKGWARYVKLQYHENLEWQLAIPSKINIMAPIDRTGRSGDHVPFSNQGYRAIRMCSYNEPGDGGGGGREHLQADSGGVDVNRDGVIDSFFVSFGFLKRNAQVDGNGVAMAAIAPSIPTYSITNIGNNRLRVAVTAQTGYQAYRLGIRTASNDFDSVYTFTRLVDTLQMPVSSNLKYYASIASQDGYGIESFFGTEVTLDGTGSSARINAISANALSMNNVLVQWKADNTIADYYEVERSEDNTYFTPIGTVKASFLNLYNFHDHSPLEGESFYRLRAIGTGLNNISDVKSLTLSADDFTHVIPSPAHNYFVVKTKAVAGTPAEIADLQGRKLMKLKITDGQQVDITSIPAGLYLLKVSNGEVVKFSKN